MWLLVRTKFVAALRLLSSTPSPVALLGYKPLQSPCQALKWRSRLCPRLADPRQCRVLCRGRYHPQSLLRCLILLHRAPQVSCRHWRPGAFIPTEQLTPVTDGCAEQAADARAVHIGSQKPTLMPTRQPSPVPSPMPTQRSIPRLNPMPTLLLSATLAPPPCSRCSLRTRRHRYRHRGPRPT
jgi:hypothetical protein